MARSCRSGMSAVWSLPGVNRTWRGEPNSVEIDPGCVKTWTREERAELCSLFLLSAAPAREVLLLFDVFEKNVLRESLISEFSHSLDPQQTLLPRRTGILPFRFRLPLNRQLLRFGDLCRGHLLRDAISIADRILVTSRSRQTEPHVCLNIVLRHA